MPRPSKARRRRAHAALTRAYAQAEIQFAQDVRRAMRRAVAALLPKLRASVEARDRHHPRQDASIEDDELLDLEDEATARLLAEAKAAHARMARKVVASNARALGGLGIDLREEEPHLDYLIKRSRERCLGFLRDKTRDYVRDVRDVMSDPENFGLRPEALADLLLERGNVAASRAELVARDQTLRLNREVTKQRQTEAGIESFVWSTSMDERVRPEHQELEGKVFPWSNPPSEIDDINCRCTQVPILPEEE